MNFKRLALGLAVAQVVVLLLVTTFAKSDATQSILAMGLMGIICAILSK
jgi:hypothetical protein